MTKSEAMQIDIGKALADICAGYRDKDNERTANAMVDIVRYVEQLEQRISNLENRNRLRDWPL